MRFAIEGVGRIWCLTQYDDAASLHWVLGYFPMDDLVPDDDRMMCVSSTAPKTGEKVLRLPLWMQLA